MALEAGSAMHEMFAAARLWQLMVIQKLPLHTMYNGKRIFGAKRWQQCWEHCVSHTDPRDQLLELCFAVLHSGGWKDNPSDATRTMTSMELSTIVYVDERLPSIENWSIYVEDPRNPQAMVGIEQVFDVVLTYEDGREIRYIGTIDGLVKNENRGEYVLDENKTAIRIGEGWRNAFDMRHQVTGYCAASTSVFGFKVLRSRVTGLKIKPTNRGDDVYAFEPIERTEDSIQHWAIWVREMVDTYERYKDDFENATRFTHSCNRFFRSCSLLTFCSDTADGRQIAFHKQMVPAEPSPSERAVSE
jgi:hypothetical protein